VAAAEAQVELAEDALVRVERLSSKAAIAEAELVKVRHKRDAAVAMRNQARSVLQMAQVKRGQHVLRAPFSGTVLVAPDHVGEIVGPGIPQFDVADLSRLRARVSLPESAVGRVRVDQPAEVRTRGGESLEGRVALVLPALDAESHRLPIEVEVVPPEGAAGLANSFVRVRVEALEAVEAVSVPATALVRDDDTRVFVVEGGVARARAVTVLSTEGDRAIVQGVPGGVSVVDVPAPDLRDGSRVRP
jgi:RND family efflux transporter MFP subunit